MDLKTNYARDCWAWPLALPFGFVGKIYSIIISEMWQVKMLQAYSMETARTIFQDLYSFHLNNFASYFCNKETHFIGRFTIYVVWRHVT